MSDIRERKPWLHLTQRGWLEFAQRQGAIHAAALVAACIAEREDVLRVFEGYAWQFGVAGRERMQDVIENVRAGKPLASRSLKPKRNRKASK